MNTQTSTYRKIFSLLSSHKLLLINLIATSLLASLSESLGVSLTLFLLSNTSIKSNFLDRVPGLHSWILLMNDMPMVGRVRLVSAVLILIFVIRGGLFYASRVLSVRLQIKLEGTLRRQLFKQLLAVKLEFIHKEQIGNLFTILNNYTTVSGRLFQLAAAGIVDLFIISAYSAIMIFVSWQLTLIAAVLLIGITLVVRQGFSTPTRQAGQRTNHALKKLNSIGLESLLAIKLIHLFSKQEHSQSHFESALQTYSRHLFQRESLVHLTRPLFMTLNAVAVSLLLLAGSFFLAGKTDSWLSLIALFLAIAFRLMAPVASLNDTRATVGAHYSSLQAVIHFLEREDKPYIENGHIHVKGLEDKITLSHVTFCYQAGESAVLTDVSFEIPKGKITAVVGPSGAGKSTLVNLIARLYDCQTGHILIDGVDLRQLDLSDWRSSMAVVSQDTFIFNSTVTANLKFANQKASEAQVIQAARLAQAHDFIVELPQGYQTLLGDRGVRLSGGQRQRIAIARAILLNASLLILDEATSSLDSEIEQEIQADIERYSQGRTVLIIAHRLSTIRHADNIVVLDQGQVVEQGTHNELMNRRGPYYRLVQAQN
ncbi:MAG: ABC transporter ATP-binding protein [Aestuariibacter sp.]|nr:ABC transporter ATP-binding protein [Aestuariibacter sp.]